MPDREIQIQFPVLKVFIKHKVGDGTTTMVVFPEKRVCIFNACVNDKNRRAQIRMKYELCCFHGWRARWGRKCLKLTRIVLSIRLIGYNSCVLCCSFLLMEWTGFNRRHWSIKNCHLTFTREESLLMILNCVLCTTCSVKWYLRPLESPPMIFQQILIRSSRSKHALWNMEM